MGKEKEGYELINNKKKKVKFLNNIFFCLKPEMKYDRVSECKAKH